MNELRELLLTREVPDLEALRQEADAPPGGPRAEGFYFAGLFNAVLTLVVYHGSLYLELLRETEEHGPSAEIDAAAIQASVDVALVQQSIWQRREMIGAVRDTPLDLVPAMGILDALIFSLLALTGRDERCALARLDAERLEARLRAKALLDWVEATGYDRALPADGVATLCQAREEGANEEELIEMTWETIGRALAASD